MTNPPEASTHPRTWVILSDKRGDNGQVETIVDALPWSCERKFVQMKPQWVLGKPPFRPTLDHIDLEKSDPLEGPWPDLILTVGRRPAMVSLWVREQSGGHSRVVTLGKPSGMMLEFELVIASAENQMPPMHNFLPISLPLMRISAGDVEAQAMQWRDRLGDLPRPLIALLVGGETNPFIMNRQVANDLIAQARWVIEELGGTPYITTSRRTTAEVVEVLRDELPEQAVLFEWTAQAEENPYRALLGTADGFIVTGDSISMMIEVIQLGKPLAIFPLPGGMLGSLDQLRRSFAHWLFNPVCSSFADRLRHRIGRAMYYIDVFSVICATRDFKAFHGMLVDRGLAVWAGQPFRDVQGEIPDDISIVVERIRQITYD